MPDGTIASDPQRQATDAIRGYVYQIYQSLYAWIALKPEEVLALEGAEDFDIRGNGLIEVVQVKDTQRSSSVTLRSPGVVSAMNHFWDLSRTNPHTKVHFRFLTTSPRGREQGKPFGKNTTGLDYWDRVKRSAVPSVPLAEFILGLDVSEELRRFVEDAPSSEFVEKLIRPIHWDTGHRATEGLIQIIDDRLIAHGLKIGVPAHDSKIARAKLLERVVTVITDSEDRVLRFGEFADLFEQATGRWESRARLNALQNEGVSRLSAVAALSPLTDVTLAPPILEAPPPLVQGAHPRMAVVKDLAAVLDEQKALFLYGSAGLGKTTLARLLVAESDKEWLWASFRGTAPEQLRQLLARAASRMNLLSLKPYFVLDDIDFARLAEFEPSLIGLVFAALVADGRVIITSQSKAPPGIFAKLWIDSACKREAPYFTEEDTRFLAEVHGCPGGKELERWAALIWTTTRGHPQLVHARVRHLQSEGWPAPSTDDLFLPADVEEVRRHASRRLMAELPVDVRTLAYRLSILTSAFSRRMVMALAAVSPSIALPGEAFETLLGPWVEQQGIDMFRVSPLLKGSGPVALDARELPLLHEAIALTYFRTDTVTPFEASTALIHALAARKEGVLAYIANGIMTAPYEAWRILADHLFWLPAMARDAGQMIFQENPAINAILRGVQFRIAANLSDKSAAMIIGERWLSEVEQLENDEVRDSMRLLAYSNILMSFELPFRPRFIVRLIPLFVQLHQTEAHHKFELPGQEGRIPAIEGEGGRLDPLKAFVGFEIARIDGIEAFQELLDALLELADAERMQVLQPLSSEPELAEQLIGRSWLPEVGKGSAGVSGCIAAFQRALPLAKSWSADSLVVALYVAISVLRDEYQHDTGSALAVLAEAEGQVGRKSPRLLNQQAKVRFGMKDYKGALGIWDDLFAQEWQWSVTERVFGARLAGMAAAHEGHWQKAEWFFRRGSDLCEGVDSLNTMRVGFNGDAAFARWKQGDRLNSVAEFADVLRELEKLSDLSDLRTRALHAVVAHTIAWIYFDARGKPISGYTEPQPGLMSSQERNDEFMTHSIQGLPLVWSLLGLLEGFLGYSLGIMERGDQEMRGDLPIPFQAMRNFDRVERDFDEADFEHLISHYILITRCLLTTQRMGRTSENPLAVGVLVEIPNDYWNSDERHAQVIDLLLTAVVALVARKPTQSLPLEAWWSELVANSILHPDLNRFIDLARQPLAHSGAGDLWHIALAAILRVREEVPAADELFRCHFYIINALTQIEWGRLVACDFEHMVVAGWRSAVQTQRFALRLPSLTVPEILAACDERSSSGYTKAARVLLAAAGAVGAKLSSDARLMLEKAAAQPCENH